MRDLGLADIVTPTVRTGGGRLQMYFRHAPGLRNRVGVVPGVDVRTTGGQVVLPGSVHPKTGRTYEWILGPETPLAEFPAHLLARLKAAASPGPREPVRSVPASEATARVAALGERRRRRVGLLAHVRLDRLARRLAQTPEGERNVTLFRVACEVYETGNSALLDEDLAAERLRDAAEECGLPADEVAATLKSAADRVAGQGVELRRRAGRDLRARLLAATRPPASAGDRLDRSPRVPAGCPIAPAAGHGRVGLAVGPDRAGPAGAARARDDVADPAAPGPGTRASTLDVTGTCVARPGGLEPPTS